ncbi:MAG: hypothetical protein KKG47_09275 [Proteobacteria bacterium]|nr:hypothetical protein [Pseudomonadota bacterium]MBU1737145.1 hypothetical protein [Pseudomonadota bacterium]
MKTYFVMLVLLLVAITPTTTLARNSVDRYLIKEALAQEKAKAKLDGRIKFFFGDKYNGKVKKSYGVFKTNKKTNAFLKSDKEACEWVFLTAMKSLQSRALQQGGNAVINIRSNYKNNEMNLTDHFTCGAGAVIAGTSLKGEVVRME